MLSLRTIGAGPFPIVLGEARLQADDLAEIGYRFVELAERNEQPASALQREGLIAGVDAARGKRTRAGLDTLVELLLFLCAAADGKVVHATGETSG